MKVLRACREADLDAAFETAATGQAGAMIVLDDSVWRPDGPWPGRDRDFTSGVLRGHRGTKTGIDHEFLVLADVSGFTAFVTASEIEHGPPIIAELLAEVIGQLSPPLEIQAVEGDAVFGLGRDQRLATRSA